MTESRMERLDELMRLNELDAIALNPGPSLTYLTGLHFHLMERPVVMLIARGKRAAIVLPELETLKLASLDLPVETFPYGENPGTWADVFQQATAGLDLDGRKVGIEPRALRLLEFRYLQAAIPRADFPDASPALSALRICKEPEEISNMRIAVKIAQDALEATLPLIKIGMTEKELANELVIQLLRSGSEPEMPFSPIVSSGPNSANPHASPSERVLQPGDLLVIDWGAAHAGYISDLTRTFAVGEVDSEFQRIYEIVKKANAAGREAGGPGIPCAAVEDRKSVV